LSFGVEYQMYLTLVLHGYIFKNIWHEIISATYQSVTSFQQFIQDSKAKRYILPVWINTDARFCLRPRKIVVFLAIEYGIRWRSSGRRRTERVIQFVPIVACVIINKGILSCCWNRKRKVYSWIPSSTIFDVEAKRLTNFI
jgi:hypothetical protein